MSRKTLIFLFLLYFNFCNAEDIKKPIYIENVSNANYNDLLAPNEDRDFKYVDFLSQSLKISSNGASGSGTIIYYDKKTNYSYVISCGHLWNGDKNFNDNNKPKAKVITWYKNKLKLDKPESFDAEVLFWSNKRGFDVSCLRFKPNWTPQYINMADPSYKFKNNLVLNSLGCDGGREVARYEVFYQKTNNVDIITSKNSPRPGRSGGGLITNEGLFVGICWGTSDTVSGNGIGYFTPLSSAYDVFEKNSHIWVLKSSQVLNYQKIPIYDWNKFEIYNDNNLIPIPILKF
jgi:hypothetical protein